MADRIGTAPERQGRVTSQRGYWNIAEALTLAGVALLLACLFDYRYATNDDTFIQAIVSGGYSGEPSIHNIYSMTALNAVFALLYQICNTVPWFGIFMVASQFFSLYGVLSCLGRKLEIPGFWRRMFLPSVNLILIGLMLRELLILQYTFTAALLATAAMLRLYCLEGAEDGSPGILGRYFGVLAQYLLALCLRKEMFLYLLPFSVSLTLISYHKRNGFRIVGRELRYRCAFWGSLLACVLGLYAADGIGYSGRNWSEYRNRLNVSRTRLYDFLALPDYEGNRSFYESAGISQTQYELLKNYNFALDDTITNDTLQSVADYVDDERSAGYRGVERLYMRLFTLPLREGLWSYRHRLLFDPEVSRDDYPWNFVSAGLYLVLIVLTWFSKRFRNFAYMGLLFSVRSALWMYIILKQRTPPRVVHPLFAAEIVCLLLLVFEELSRMERKGNPRKSAWICPAVAVVFLVGGVAVTAAAGCKLAGEYGSIINYNEEWRELTAYCAQREENFYFMDVYSTVNYTEKIFGGEYGRVWNYDICGGWLAKSPLCEEKYARFGFSSPQKALIEKENVFFVAEKGSDLGWLTDLYAEKGIRVGLEYRDAVAEQFDVIKLHANLSQ